MIMNIFYPDSGTIRVFGREMRGANTDRIGYLPEERGLYKKMKVRDLLRFYGELKSGRRVNREVEDWLERLGLSAWANKKIETLSKGMAQKVQFIAAVVAKPELIILDEPFTGLDPVNLEALKDAVLDLRSRGATVIFSTHDLNVAEKMCDFIFMIFKGRKVLDGTLSAIQDEYGSDTLRLRAEGGISSLKNLDGVEKVTDFGRLQELRLGSGIVIVGSYLAALGSSCNDPKDAQNMQFPAMIPVFLPMFLAMPILQEPTSAFATALSLFPLFTPMLMLLRKATPIGIPAWQPWVGLAGVILFTVFSVWMGGRIFRIGILIQGGPPKLSKIFRWAIRG
jgi:ABC-type uncharacterized transport system ATPase subunit